MNKPNAARTGETEDLLDSATQPDPRFQICDGTMIWTDQGISILCQQNTTEGTWDYVVFHGETPITKVIKSRKAPYEDEPARRDPALRRLYGTSETKPETVSLVWDAFGLYLMQHAEQIDAYKNIISPPEKTLRREKVELTDDEKADALKFLRDPNLVERIISLIRDNGLVGEHVNGFSAFVIILSTLTEEPSSMVCGGDTSTGKTALVKAVIPLFPPEMMFIRAGVTPKVLYYDADETEDGTLVNDLTGFAIIILEEEESEDFLKIIKPLLSHDQSEIVYSYVNNGKNGNQTTNVKIVGFPSYIGLRARRIRDEQVKTRMITLTPEFNAPKFESVLDSVTYRVVAPWAHKPATSPELPQNAIRMLRRVNVVIPFMGVVREFFEYTRPRAVRDFGQFITMIRTVTTLHQHQRMHVTLNDMDFVVAHLDDLDVSLRLFESMYCEAVSGIPRDVKEFFESLVPLSADCYTKKTLFLHYKNAMKGTKSINWFVERFIDPLVDLGLIEIDKTDKTYLYTVHAENLSTSFKREEIIEELCKTETQERIRSDYLTGSEGNHRHIHTPTTTEVIDSICMFYSVEYDPGRFNTVFGLCVTDEYPRRYSKSDLEGVEKSPDDDKLSEGVDETAGTHIMRLIEEGVRKADRKEDAETLTAIMVHIIDTGSDPALVNYCMTKFRDGHRIFIPPRRRTP